MIYQCRFKVTNLVVNLEVKRMFKIGDYVESNICRKISGKIKNIIDNENFTISTGNKDMLCNVNFYRRVYGRS